MNKMITGEIHLDLCVETDYFHPNHEQDSKNVILIQKCFRMLVWPQS